MQPFDCEVDFCRVQFTPTVQHCSMATLIGLCIRVKLLRSLPRRFKVSVSAVMPDTGIHPTKAAFCISKTLKRNACSSCHFNKATQVVGPPQLLQLYVCRADTHVHVQLTYTTDQRCTHAFVTPMCHRAFADAGNNGCSAAERCKQSRAACPYLTVTCLIAGRHIHHAECALNRSSCQQAAE